MREDLQAFLGRAHALRAASSSSTASLPALCSLEELRAPREEDPTQLTFEALRGRLIEVSASGASAVLTAAIGWVLQAQLAAEPVVWVTLRESSFYPPDVVECGVDIEAIVVIRVGDVHNAGKVAERLLRSTAFGLVILDLGTPEWVIERNTLLGAPNRGHSLARYGRLVALAKKSETLVVCITNKNDDMESMSSLVSLRADAFREQDRTGLSVALRVLKDKRRGPGWIQRQRARGPAGLI